MHAGGEIAEIRMLGAVGCWGGARGAYQSKTCWQRDLSADLSRP